MKILCVTPVRHIKGVCELLESYGEVVYDEVANKVEVRQLLKNGYDILYVNPNKMTYRIDDDLMGASSLKAICTASTGTNHIDKIMCERRGIKILSLTADYEVIERITSTAEHAFCLMISLIRNLPTSFKAAQDLDWDYTKFIGRQLDHLTAGIVGYGRLGRMMAKYCQAFGMKVLVCDPYKGVDGFECVDFTELCSRSDVISLHIHLDDKTANMINASAIQKCNGVYLVNTSRGGVVDEAAVIDGLASGKLAGYGTDVVVDELGDIENSALIQRSHDLNIIVTPHIGGMTREAQEIAYNSAANKIGDLDE